MGLELDISIPSHYPRFEETLPYVNATYAYRLLRGVVALRIVCSEKKWTLCELLAQTENRRGQLDEGEAKNSQSEAGAATQQYQVSSQLKFRRNHGEIFREY